MATILALDASTDICSVALRGPSLNLTLHSDEPRTHSQKLIPLIDEILRSGKTTLDHIDAIAFGSGPGSFTGLRIAFGCAQGLAFGANVPMVAVSGLEAMAAAAPQGERFATACVLDARMGEVYWAAYSVVGGGITSLLPPQLSSPKEAEQELIRLRASGKGQIALVGPGALLFDAAAMPDPTQIFPDIRPSAQAIAALALSRYERGEATAAEHAQLSYLRDSVSWNKRQRVRKAPWKIDQ